MYKNFFIHSSVDEPLGSFHVPAIINSAVINTGVPVSFSIMVFSGYMPSSWIVGSYGSFIPSCLFFFFFCKESHTVLHSDCISLHSHQDCKWVPFSPHPHKHLLFVDCFNNGHSDWCEAIYHCSFNLHFSNE